MSWDNPILLWTSPIGLLLLHPIDFDTFYFCFHLSLGIFLLISSVTHWLFSSILFNLRFFFQFASCNWCLVSYHCGQKKMLAMISVFFGIYWDLFCGLTRDLCMGGRKLHVHLRRMCIVLLLGGTLFIYLLRSYWIMCHLRPLTCSSM